MPEKSAQELFDSLSSVAKLVGDLAMNVADAQNRLDTDYVRNLTQFAAAFNKVVADKKLTPEQFEAFFRSLAPSHYQFTETVIEVRADLQMSSFTEAKFDASLGYKNPVFAATLNASYVKRSAYDSRAAATIRAVLHAVQPDPQAQSELLAAARQGPGAQLQDGSRFKTIADALSSLLPAQE